MSHYDGVDRQRELNCCHCRIERAHIFQLLKPLNITSVFVYPTVKLFLDTGGVKDTAGLARFVRYRLLMLLGQELTEILCKNKKSWFEKWILH